MTVATLVWKRAHYESSKEAPIRVETGTVSKRLSQETGLFSSSSRARSQAAAHSFTVERQMTKRFFLARQTIILETTKLSTGCRFCANHGTEYPGGGVL